MYNSETKILVTGGAGFVGTNFINDLLNRGHNPDCIAIIDNMEQTIEALCQRICSVPEITTILKIAM